MIRAYIVDAKESRGTGIGWANTHISITAYCSMNFAVLLKMCSGRAWLTIGELARHTAWRRLALPSPGERYVWSRPLHNVTGVLLSSQAAQLFCTHRTLSEPNSIHCLQPCLRLSAELSYRYRILPPKPRHASNLHKRLELSLPKRLNSPNETI